ncbi:methylisocitrate lyase [Sulfolobus acidocaldarius]|uniref:Methylisocitrate lyase n=4 Tax=Sulfolobus acidocaldarius TaxID=2285 RepID=Q4JC18_SULAC|nr:methylisocitrate lyase [Sulfolobus acidocaldarius]AAY79661.1 carboxyvinyl-carboxyphosphonate phosphorylmutase [Sulfolobus acidocaldarius DSM 639]AGE70219.1 carboxyvinyl-carboxyphosphonate phosphorylmutase [Sulfolobus acidocaldarius N8]AGE72494.1 carboxyvinyl-carboxyphosphonate phosphorylmutase [Sulfolobus acidocaldarius Ron12/I]ALU29373.1 methylisocitrate lyase [Sulfolobus acidocaldarius]ALU32102.1 methylisocitrate lyase [Sulfolobus acidocaldarius]
MSELLRKADFLLIPGVFNPFTALLAEQVGFKAVYLSGGAYTSSLGMPDLGIITLDELAWIIRRIREVTDIPIIVDADTGFGEVLNVYRAVKVLESAGANAIQIEDQVLPKKCGHLDGKEVVHPRDMVSKIKAALKARKEMLIIARTDSRAVNGLDDAIQRAKTYLEAGADIIFPEAMESKDEFQKFAKEVKAPLLANMTEFGKTPYITAKEFREMGYKYVIFPVTIFRVAAKAMKDALEVLMKEGTQKSLLDKMMTRKEQYEVIKYYSYEDLDKQLAKDL